MAPCRFFKNGVKISISAIVLISLFLFATTGNISAKNKKAKAAEPVSVYKAGNPDKKGYLIFEIKAKGKKLFFPLTSDISGWNKSGTWRAGAGLFKKLLPGLPGKDRKRRSRSWRDFYRETVDDFYKTATMRIRLADGTSRLFKFIPKAPGAGRLPAFDPSPYFLEKFKEWENFVIAGETLDSLFKSINPGQLVIPPTYNALKIKGFDKLRNANFQITAIPPLFNTIVAATLENNTVVIKRADDVYSDEIYLQISVAHKKFRELKRILKLKVVFGDKTIATLARENLLFLLFIIIVPVFLIIRRLKSRPPSPEKLEADRRERLDAFDAGFEALEKEVDELNQDDFSRVMKEIEAVLQNKRQRFAGDIERLKTEMEQYWRDRVKDILQGFESVFHPLADWEEFNELFEPAFWLSKKQEARTGALQGLKKDFSKMEIDLPKFFNEMGSQLERTRMLVDCNLRSYRDIIQELKLSAGFERLSEILTQRPLGAPGARAAWMEEFSAISGDEEKDALMDAFWREIWEKNLADAVGIVQEALFKLDLVLMSVKKENLNSDERVTRLYGLRMTINAVLTIFHSMALACGRVCHAIGPFHRMTAEFSDTEPGRGGNILKERLFADCVKHYEMGRHDEVIDVIEWGVSRLGKKNIETDQGARSRVVLYKDRFKKPESGKPDMKIPDPGGAHVKQGAGKQEAEPGTKEPKQTAEAGKPETTGEGPDLNGREAETWKIFN